MAICSLLFANVDWVAVLAAAMAQHFFSYFYYATLIAAPFTRLMANDKGVTDASKVVMRYDMLKCVLISFIASIARALFIIATLNTLKLTATAECKLCAYFDAALLVSAVTVIGSHADMWNQRHFKLQFFEILGDVSSAVLAALVLYSQS
ncbi:membrane-associated protein, putative [Bodo saltans]|uniref:Membrane-associated protein, putative n=1 Tax=Bodo saltans TaxID=75058 RepID=A0A0S4IK77_BODSA|nr:membrane-associated protein, putative [Bodo saltans]|eukprot:CUE63429.1 membrane-associated protein, putative [Bodo saltans]